MQPVSGKKNGGETARIKIQGSGVGAPAVEAVEQRARELAQIEGRTSQQVTKEDRLRASRELQGEMFSLSTDEARSDVVASRNSAEVAVEIGHKAGKVMPVDEQQLEEKAVKEGVREAEHEHMLEGQK